jgi:LPXTG-motif cell wall-anchored protein
MHRPAFVVALIALGASLTFAPAGAAPAVTTPPGAASARLAARSLAAPAPVAKPRAVSGPTVVISSNCATFCFVPAQLTVVAGQTVTWVNRSGAPHTVTRCSRAACNGVSGGNGTDATFTTGDIGIASGAMFRHAFTAPGTYVYFCTLHGYPVMHGTITVTAAVPTTAVPTTIAAPVTAPPTPAPGPTTPPSPALANTGTTSGGVATWAIVLVASGIAAIVLGRRRSAPVE